MASLPTLKQAAENFQANAAQINAAMPTAKEAAQNFRAFQEAMHEPGRANEL